MCGFSYVHKFMKMTSMYDFDTMIIAMDVATARNNYNTTKVTTALWTNVMGSILPHTH